MSSQRPRGPDQISPLGRMGAGVGGVEPRSCLRVTSYVGAGWGGSRKSALRSPRTPKPKASWSSFNRNGVCCYCSDDKSKSCS